MAECTIYDKLRYIQETKDLIKTAIETQDVEVLESDAFRKYAEYITEIRKVSSVNGQQGDIILKTINGEDLVGEGDLQLQVEVDLSDYYNKEEVDAKIPDVSKFITEIPSEYITESELNEKGYLTSIPDTYVTDEELSTATSDKVSQTALNEAIEGLEAKIPTVVEYTAGNGISMSEDNIISLNTISWANKDSNDYDLRAKTSNGYNVIYRITGDETIKISDTNGYTNYAIIGVNTDNVAVKTDIPTNTSDLNNDSGFITESDLKTINGETIVGEGNITIQGGTGTINIVELTQSEYNALTEYADNTFYVITDASELTIPTKTSELTKDDVYTKSEINAMIGGVSEKITEINNLL